MNRETGMRATLALAIMVALVGVPVEATPRAGLRSEKAARLKMQPLSASELKAVYGDRTWQWGTGGGRFDLSGQRFEAYTTEGGKPSLGEGRWQVDDNGKLCIFAEWTARDGSGRAATCFGHARYNGVVYQKRYPKGNWYVFRHAPERPGDESRKLIAANTIRSEAALLREQFENQAIEEARQ